MEYIWMELYYVLERTWYRKYNEAWNLSISGNDFQETF